MERQPTEQHEIIKTFRPPSSPETSPERPTESASTSRAVPRPESDQETTSEQDETSEYETKDSNDDDEMTSTASPKEIQLNNPKPFNGDRNNLNKFIQACSTYLDLDLLGIL